MHTPKVTVLMAVYNGERYVREAIDSILSQTFRDFEFVIVDDGSTDTSVQIIESYTDPRIVFLKNEKNIGLALTLNRGIDVARGQYIARMDADDISLPRRLEKQVTFMDAHPDIALSGTWARTFGAGQSHIMRNPTKPDEVKVNLLFRTSLIHPSIILRKSFLQEHNMRYRDVDGQVGYVEDFDLYTRAVQYGNIANLGKILLAYRRHSTQVSSVQHETQISNAIHIIQRQLTHLGMTPTPEELRTVVSAKRYLFLDHPEFPTELEKLLLKIKSANNVKKIYSDIALRKVFGDIWLEVVLSFALHHEDVWQQFRNAAPRKWIRLTPRNIVRILKIYRTHIQQ